MDLSEEFRKHAAECVHMAKSTRDPRDRGVWHSLAERWVRCAERVESRSIAAHRRAGRHRATPEGQDLRRLMPQQQM